MLRTAFITPSRQIFDADLGWQYLPNSKIIHSKEGYAVHKLNELGMNDEPLSRKTNRDKILVLGDSFTEALEVPRKNNFVAKLSDRHANTDFINAGRGAYAPPHQLIVIERMAKYFQPTLNLLFLSHGDLHDLVSLPLMIHRTQDGKILDFTPVNEKKDALKDRFRLILHNSALATYIMRRYHLELKRAIRFISNPCVWQCKQSDSLKNTSGNNESRAIVAKTEQKNQREMLTYIFKQLNAVAPTRIFYIPNVVYKHQHIADISSYSKKELSTISAAAQNAGLPFYSLTLPLLDDYERTGLPAFGFSNTKVGGEGHLNIHGHQVVASYVEGVLKINL